MNHPFVKDYTTMKRQRPNQEWAKFNFPLAGEAGFKGAVPPG